MKFTIPNAMKPILDFVTQVAFGAIGFLVVFGAALLISMAVKASEGLAPEFVHATAEYFENALFAVDLFCFSLFILSETFKLIRGLWNELREP